MIMEGASDTKGEVPETLGTTWESQRKLPRDIRGRILQAKERETRLPGQRKKCSLPHLFFCKICR